MFRFLWTSKECRLCKEVEISTSLKQDCTWNSWTHILHSITKTMTAYAERRRKKKKKTSMILSLDHHTRPTILNWFMNHINHIKGIRTKKYSSECLSMRFQHPLKELSKQNWNYEWPKNTVNKIECDDHNLYECGNQWACNFFPCSSPGALFLKIIYSMMKFASSALPSPTPLSIPEAFCLFFLFFILQPT